MLQTFNVPAGGRIVNTAAQWFRVESVSSSGLNEAVSVRADGQDLGTYLPGDALTLPQFAKTWEIKPVTATATAIVRLGMGTVQSARLSGVVSVVNSEVSSLSTVVQGPNGLPAGFNVVALVAPASNTNGLILRSGDLSCAAAAGVSVAHRIWASPSVPVANGAAPYSFSGAWLLSLVVGVGAAGSTGTVLLPNVRLPKGWGVWHTVEPAGGASGQAYSVLSFETL